MAVRGISAALNNPKTGGSIMQSTASSLLSLLGSLLETADDDIEALREFTETVQNMNDEGREPTGAEWDSLQRRSREAGEKLDEARERLGVDLTLEEEEIERRVSLLKELVSVKSDGEKLAIVRNDTEEPIAWAADESHVEALLREIAANPPSEIFPED